MIKGTPSKESIGQVIDRLGSDPAFREKMLGDPKAALAEHGIDVDEDKIPAVRKLPSMEDMKLNREAYQQQLSDKLGYQVFFLR